MQTKYLRIPKFCVLDYQIYLLLTPEYTSLSYLFKKNIILFVEALNKYFGSIFIPFWASLNRTFGFEIIVLNDVVDIVDTKKYKMLILHQIIEIQCTGC